MLEEAYLYIDMPAPGWGLQLVYTDPRNPELVTVVRDGDCVLMPQGYHPNVAAPGSQINFLWMMAANRDGRGPPVRRRERAARVRAGRLGTRGLAQMSGPFSLAGRVAIVTGASGGLGAAYAVALAEAGADVAVHDRSPVEETCQRVRALGRRTLALLGDITDPQVPERVVREPVVGLGRLDIVVNNAGTIRRAPAAETSDEDWLAVIDVNLSAVFRMCRAAGRHMLAQGHGKIVNVASLLAFQGGILVPAYAASFGF